MNHTTYTQWQYSQLEPNEVLITGNAKRWGLLTLDPPRRIVEVQAPKPVETEAEQTAAQDEYLKRCGIE